MQFNLFIFMIPRVYMGVNPKIGVHKKDGGL